MMRTSPSQFEVMIDFMERNGDLNKPTDGPHGRLTAINKWQELANVLTMDTTGTHKPVERWKKVWSDLKNNTKRKAAKINQHVGTTGIGQACKLVLTDLELRVLSIIGPQAVTGLISVEEVGVELVSPLGNEPSLLAPPPPHPPQPLPPHLLPESDTPAQMDVQVSVVEDWNRPGGSSQTTPFYTEVLETAAASPTQHSAQSPPQVRPTQHSAQSPNPPRTRPQHYASPQRSRRVIRRRHSTPRRTRPSTRVDAATQQFLASDEHWRNFAKEFTTEHLRLREVELQRQAEWQTLFAKGLDLLERYMNK